MTLAPMYVIFCDAAPCPAHTPAWPTRRDALDEARRIGWSYSPFAGHRCPAHTHRPNGARP